jgi:hypothetical protein
LKSYLRGSYPRAVIDPNGRVWPSISEASRRLGVPPTTVRDRCARQLFGWRFADPPQPTSPRHPQPLATDAADMTSNAE